MRALKLLLALAVVAGAASASAQPAASGARAFGVWRNPKNSVHVDIRPCGPQACGYVVWASEKAKADARKGGTANLVGLQLLRDMSLDKSGVWRGRVFVPDLNMTFSGAAEPVDINTLRARGCLIGSIGCKTQTWTRVEGPVG
jgi:uncharacterized protein (DUF2147 family)